MEKERKSPVSGEMTEPYVMENDYTNVANNQDLSKKLDENYSLESIAILTELECVRRKIQPINFMEERMADCIVKVVNETKRACKEMGTGIIENPTGTYIYNGKFWDKVDKKALAILVAALSTKMGINPTTAQRSKYIEDIQKQISCSCYLNFPDTPEGTTIINLNNGELHIKNGKTKLKPHNIGSFQTYILPYNYDPNATCPIFDKYLEEVLPDNELRNVVQEYIGYLFITGLKLEKALFLSGGGFNGKSVLIEVLTAMLGKNNITNYSLESLTRNDGRYIPMIANKLANLCTDIGRTIEDAAKFKQLVSGEPIEGRALYQNPEIFSKYAKLIFSMNDLPIVTDQSKGFYRRFLIVPFSVTIPKDKADKTLHVKIIKSELPGVLNWVLAGLDRLVKQGDFSEAKAVDEQMTEFRRAADNVAMFLHEKGYEPSINNKVVFSELFLEYQKYCIESGYHATAKRVFQSRINQLGVETKTGTGNKLYAWTEVVPHLEKGDEGDPMPF